MEDNSVAISKNKANSPAKNIVNMNRSYLDILVSAGENPLREGLLNTPKRAAKSFEYLTSGYSEDITSIVNNALFTSSTDQMVFVRDIEFYSLCEHHLLPFWGTCSVAYIPNGKIIGLSKIPRIVDVFARRLQTQENLTEQVAKTIMEVTGAKGVGVITKAEHFCVMMRGVKKQSTSTLTMKMLGDIKTNSQAKEDFLSLYKA